ncbi:hypothetical protein CFR71_07300 [Novacetimonas pomaceti]|uniref:Uncharacterized protein n=1 Tax=Novacetimonas pomaceti TaxID=2021998 RepID=A0A318QES0_9PROT|nr:hypothetical protein CFR71_07300 [Novacetimonas pomaceti]
MHGYILLYRALQRETVKALQRAILTDGAVFQMWVVVWMVLHACRVLADRQHPGMNVLMILAMHENESDS